MVSIAIIFGIFLTLLFLGVPIVFSLGFPSLIWLAMNPHMSITIASQKMMSQLLSFTIIAMPGFLFVGRLMNTSGVTDRLFRFSIAMVGRFRGGLAQANAFASMLFASMSGNAVADAGGLGLVEMTMMKKAGYRADFSAGITAASSILGPIIPPSQIMVLVGSIAQISVASLFYGGIIPGIILTGALMLLTSFRATFTAEGRKWPRTKIPWQEAVKTIPGAIPPLMTFVIIIGSIMGGVCTPTEAAVLAVWWAIFLGICYKKLTWKTLWRTIDETVRTAGVFMLIMSIASFFAWIVTIEGLPQAIRDLLRTISGGSIPIMFFLCGILFLIIGCFLDTGSAVLLVTPIMLPAVIPLGIDPVHFALVLIIGIIIGAITPPFGLCLFVVSDVGNVPVKDVTKEALKYLPAMLITLILVILFPKIVTWLPNLLLR
jgi:tripartite ATP-independent transporter DctM subunit